MNQPIETGRTVHCLWHCQSVCVCVCYSPIFPASQHTKLSFVASQHYKSPTGHQSCKWNCVSWCVFDCMCVCVHPHAICAWLKLFEHVCVCVFFEQRNQRRTSACVCSLFMFLHAYENVCMVHMWSSCGHNTQSPLGSCAKMITRHIMWPESNTNHKTMAPRHRAIKQKIYDQSSELFLPPRHKYKQQGNKSHQILHKIHIYAIRPGHNTHKPKALLSGTMSHQWDSCYLSGNLPFWLEVKQFISTNYCVSDLIWFISIYTTTKNLCV